MAGQGQLTTLQIQAVSPAVVKGIATAVVLQQAGSMQWDTVDAAQLLLQAGLVPARPKAAYNVY